MSATERSYCVISEKDMVKRLWSYGLWDIEGRNIKKLLSQHKNTENCIFKDWHVANGSSESNNLEHFLKELSKTFQMQLNILPKLWLIFCCHHQKIQKMSHFCILMPLTQGVNMITRQTTPFFSSTLWALSVGIFHFCISRL